MKIRKRVPEKMYLILLVFILSFASVGCERKTDSEYKENISKESKFTSEVKEGVSKTKSNKFK